MSWSLLCRSYNIKMCLNLPCFSVTFWVTIWTHVYSNMSINNLFWLYHSIVCFTMSLKKINIICLWYIWLQWHKWVFRWVSSSIIWVASNLRLCRYLSRSLLWKYYRPQVLQMSLRMRLLQLPSNVPYLYWREIFVFRPMCTKLPNFPCNYLRKPKQTVWDKLWMHCGIFCIECYEILCTNMSLRFL